MSPGDLDLIDLPPDTGHIEAFANLLRGLHNPDRKQREKFEAFYEAAGLATMGLAEPLPLLTPLETARKHVGSPRISPPWRNVV
jgi:hypothetical protein